MENVIPEGWDIVGEKAGKDWDNGSGYPPASGDDTALRIFKDVDPKTGGSAGVIYELDVPGASSALGTAINHTTEKYRNFTRWVTVTLDGVQQASDDALWSYQAWVDVDKPAGMRVEKNELSTSHADLSTFVRHYNPR